MHKQSVLRSSKFVFVGTSVVLSLVLLAVSLFLISAPAYAGPQDTPEGFDAWQPLDGPLGPGGKVEALALGTGTLSDTLYTIVGMPYNGGMSRVYRSTDSAATWTPVYTSTGQLMAVAADGTDVYITGGSLPNYAIYHSSDSGVQWTEVFTGIQGRPTDQNMLALAIDPVDSDIVYAAGYEWGENEQGENEYGSLVLRTPDGGATWTSVLTTPMIGQGTTFQVLTINPVTPTTVYVGGSEGDPDTGERYSVIYRTLDGGDSWTRVYSDTGAQITALAISPFTPTVVFAGTPPEDQPGQVLRSTDGGDTWVQVTTGAGMALAIESPDAIYAMSNDGTVNKSTDGGDVWQAVGNVPDYSQPLVAGSEALYAGGQTRLLKSTDGGATWAAAVNGITSLPKLRDIDVDPQNPEKLFVASSVEGGWLSLDGGQTWTQPTNTAGWWEGDLPYEFAWLRTFAINPRNSDIVYAGSGSCHQGSILRSEDGGLSFTPVYTPTFITGNCEDGQENIFALAVAPSMSSTVYAGGNYCYQGQCNYAVMVRSTNDGASWTEVLTLPLNSTIEALAVNPRSATTVYAGGQECGEDSCQGFVYRTSDGGENWSEVYTTTQMIRSIVIDPQRPATVYAADDGYRVYKSEDAGDTWSAVRLPPWESGDVSGNLLALDPVVKGKVYLGGWGYVAETVDGGQTWDDVFSQDRPDADPGALAVNNDGYTQTLYAGFGGLWSYKRVVPGFQIYLPLALKAQ